jgi:hypothetical protein
MEGLNDSDTGAILNGRSITKEEFGGNTARVGGEIHETACSMLSVHVWGLAMRRPGVFLGVRLLYGIGRELVRGRQMQRSIGRCVHSDRMIVEDLGGLRAPRWHKC